MEGCYEAGAHGVQAFAAPSIRAHHRPPPIQQPQSFFLSDDSDEEFDPDFDHGSNDTECHTPLIFSFSPPLRPENPLRWFSAQVPQSPPPLFLPPTSLASAINDQAVFPAQKDACSFRETELIFAPMPSRGRSYRPRRMFGSIGGESVEFEVVGVGLSTKPAVAKDKFENLFESGIIDAGTSSAGTSSAAGLGATLFDQEHYKTLFYKLQTLERIRANSDEVDDLASSPSLPPVRIEEGASSPVSSSSSSSSSGREDAMWSPPKHMSLSVLPTPLSSREPSPNPSDRVSKED
jgi:hypothetical protein